MEIKDFLNENETDMFAIALEKEMRAVEVINTVVAQSNVSDEQKALLNSFKVLLEQAIEEKDLTFYEGAKDTIEEIIGKENDEEFDISNLDEVSAHAFNPILKDDEDVAKAATSVHAYLFMYKGEKDVKLSALIYKFMRDNGIDDPVDVWKPIGLGTTLSQDTKMRTASAQRNSHFFMLQSHSVLTLSKRENFLKISSTA